MGAIQSSINSVLATAAGLKIFKNMNTNIKTMAEYRKQPGVEKDLNNFLSNKTTLEELEKKHGTIPRDISKGVNEKKLADNTTLPGYHPVKDPETASAYQKMLNEAKRMMNRQETVKQQKENINNISQRSIFDKDFDKGGNLIKEPEAALANSKIIGNMNQMEIRQETVKQQKENVNNISQENIFNKGDNKINPETSLKEPKLETKEVSDAFKALNKNSVYKKAFLGGRIFSQGDIRNLVKGHLKSNLENLDLKNTKRNIFGMGEDRDEIGKNEYSDRFEKRNIFSNNKENIENSFNQILDDSKQALLIAKHPNTKKLMNEFGFDSPLDVYQFLDEANIDINNIDKIDKDKLRDKIDNFFS